jgi:hypothetical protein
MHVAVLVAKRIDTGIPGEPHAKLRGRVRCKLSHQFVRILGDVTVGKLAEFFATQKIPLTAQRRSQMLVLDREYAALEAKVKKLEVENSNLKAQLDPLEAEVERLKQQLQSFVSESNPHGYVCDHCGSPRLRPIGELADSVLGNVGVKQTVYECLRCGKEGAFPR